MILMGVVLMRVVLTGATAFARLGCCNPARDRLANMNVTGLVHWYWESVLAPCGPAPDTRANEVGRNNSLGNGLQLFLRALFREAG